MHVVVPAIFSIAAPFFSFQTLNPTIHFACLLFGKQVLSLVCAISFYLFVELSSFYYYGIAPFPFVEIPESAAAFIVPVAVMFGTFITLYLLLNLHKEIVLGVREKYYPTPDWRRSISHVHTEPEPVQRRQARKHSQQGRRCKPADAQEAAPSS